MIRFTGPRDRFLSGSGKRTLETSFMPAYTGRNATCMEKFVSGARVYIVDEHHSVRLALADRLSQSANLQVIGHTGSADEVIRDVRLEIPDIVLMEIKRSDGMGLEILRQLSTLSTAPRVVVLTSYPSFWERQAANRAGACLYLLKEIETDELIHHITDLT